METSAPKRRKTSPTTSVPVNGQNGDDYPNNTSTTPTDPAPAASSRGEGRPSFASPTRASLARHNPDVLDKHKATTAAAAAASRTRRRGAAAAAPERGASQLASDAGNDASDPVDGQREQGLTGHGESQGAANQRRPASRSPERSIGGPDGLLSAMPRRTPVKLPPRPLPPPGPADDEPINPFRGRALRRSWTGLAPPPPPPEPELPPTPEHREPSANTPPSGIHNTPSKRARRSKVLAERIRSSPSKPPSSAAAFSPSREPTTLPAATAAPPPSKPVAQRLFGARARRRMSSIGPIVIDEQPEESPVADVGAGDQAEDADHVAALALRGIEPSGPETARRAERDALLAEIAQLQADVDALARENRRFEDTDDADDADGQAAVDALRRHLLPQDAEPEVDADMQWLEVALNPISFLPFAKPSAQPPPSLFGADVSSRAKGDEPTPPVSHHPIQMTAEEELPFLQVFTPLSFSSQITVLPRGEGAAAAAPLLQRHAITVGSTTPPGLFAAQISITVDTATHTIRELAVPRLYPAAAPELAQLIADTTAATGAAARPVRSRLNNISVLGWAMAEWVRVATRRARFWCALEAELATKDGVAAAAARARARARRNKGRRGNGNKRQQRGRDASGDLDPDATEDDDEDEDQDADPSDAGSRSFSRRDLLPHMGRTAMELGVPAAGAGEEDGQTVSLMVRWRIGFDWTGEAESEVELLAGVPGKWRKADQRGKLHAIPELFQKLIKDEGDPIVAVRTVVALLSGDGS